MLIDHLFFLMLPAMLLALAMPFACTMGLEVQCLNKNFLHPALVSPYTLFFTLRNCGKHSRHNFRFRSCTTAAEKTRDLFSTGRLASANGKEGTSC